MQIPNSTKRHLPRWIPLLTILSLLAVSLSVEAQKNSGNTHLCVEFADRPGDKMLSDGNIYCSGANGGLQAVITSEGRFSFVSGTQRKAFVDVTGCLSVGGCGTVLLPGYYLVQVFQRFGIPGVPNVDLNNLTPGQSVEIVLNITAFVGDKAKNTWEVTFGHARPCTGGVDAPARVTRTGQDTWELETFAGEPACLSGTSAGGFVGNISYPFKLFLTR